MKKRNKKSWSKLAARVTLSLLVAGCTLGWAQGASAGVTKIFKTETEVADYTKNNGSGVKRDNNNITIDAQGINIGSFGSDGAYAAGCWTINWPDVQFVENNTLTFTNGITSGNMYAGYRGNYNEVKSGSLPISYVIKDNKMIIGKDSDTNSSITLKSEVIAAGYNKQYSSKLQNNILTFNVGTFDTEKIKKPGGFYDDGKVIIAGGYDAAEKNDYGTEITNNQVVINNGDFKLGRYTDLKNINNAWVDFEEYSRIYGGAGNSTHKETINGNNVTVNGGNIKLNGGSIIGGYSKSLDENTTVNSNTVNITGGSIDLITRADRESSVIAGGVSGVTANSNIVTITGGNIGIYVDGDKTTYSTNSLILGGGLHELIEREWLNYEITANENQVVVNGGKISADIIGGRIAKGEAKNNEINITNGDFLTACRDSQSTDGRIIAGGYTTEGTVQKNTVTISGGKFANETLSDYAGKKRDTLVIAGGYAISAFDVSAKVTENRVNISGGVFGLNINNYSLGDNKKIVNGSVFGGMGFIGDGYNANATVTKNTVDISGGEIYANVFGGYSGEGEVSNNTVNIAGDTIQKGTIYGGYSDNTVSSNTVNITGGTVQNGSIYGGYSNNTASLNNVNITGGTVDNHIYGNYSTNGNVEGDAEHVNVDIRNVTNLKGDVYGGYTNAGDAIKNLVKINIVGNKGNLYGGYTAKGTAQGNIINFHGTFSQHAMYGGYSYRDGDAVGNKAEILEGSILEDRPEIYGGKAGTGNANDNKVIVKGATGKDNDFANVKLIGGEGSESANNNTVTVEKGKFDNHNSYGYIYGGEATNVDLKPGFTVNGNKVNLGIDDADNNLLIIASDIYGGKAGERSGTGNVVSICSGTYSSKLITGAYFSNSINTDEAMKNEVIINTGIFEGEEEKTDAQKIYGAINISDSKLLAKAEGNKVTVNGGIFGTVDSKYVDIFGWDGNATTASGNEVIITSTKGNVDITGTIKGASVLKGSTVTENVVTVEPTDANTINITGGITGAEGFASDVKVTGNTVNIKGGTITGTGDGLTVIGGYAGPDANQGVVKDNIVNITGGKIVGDVFAGFSQSEAKVSNNTVKISNSVDLSKANLYGSSNTVSAGSTDNNKLEVGALTTNTAIKSINNFNVIDFGSLTLGATNNVDGHIKVTEESNLNYATITADSINGSGYLLTGTFSAYDINFDGALKASGGGELVTTLTEGGVKVGNAGGTTVDVKDKTSTTAVENWIKITANGATTYNLLAGKYINATGESGSGTLTLTATPESTIKTIAGAYSKDSTKKASGGTLNITEGTYTSGLKIYGGYSPNSDVNGNNVNISGGNFGADGALAEIYAGGSNKGIISDNSVNISGGNLQYANISGYEGSKYNNNTLNFFTTNGSSKQQYQGGDINSISNFTTINFGDLSEALLNNTTQTNGYIKINDGSLNYTTLTANSVATSGHLLTGSFSAYNVKLGGALSSNAVETVTPVEDGSVKVGTTSTSVTFGNKTSSVPTTNYVHVTVGDTKYDMLAGKYINATGEESGSGTLTLSATPDAAIKTVAGAYSKHPTKEVSGGTLNLSGGTYAADVKVYGGYSDGGVVKGNHLNISGGTFNVTANSNGHIIGGSSIKGTAEGNIIDISGAETVINKWVYGGYGDNANKNEVKISNGTLNSVVYGSRVNDGEATENSVQISGGTINSVVYGGYSFHIGDCSTSKANDNKVVISGGTINSYVVGGAGYEAKDNKIIIKQGIDKAASLVNALLEGNSKNTMNATDNNSLIIENLGAGTIIGSVKNFNTISFGDVALGTTSYLTVNDGSLNGTAITAESLTGEGYLISGVSTEGVDVSAIQGDAGKDKFTEKSYGIEYAISGGTSVDVKANSIYVKAGAPDEVKAVAGVISDNGAVIKGNGALNLAGTETVASGAIVAGAYAKAGNAANGTVNITGNVGSKVVYAGYTAGTGAVSGNTINVSGTANVAAADLYGGNGSNVSGNTLNLADWTADTKKIQSVNGFATINLGTVSGVNITNASNLNGTTITVSNTVGAGELISGNFAKDGITVTGFNSVASTEDYSKDGNIGVTPVSGLSSKIETNAAVTTVSLVNEASRILAGSYVDAQGVAHDAANKTLVLATTPSDKTELAGAYAVGSQAATGGTVNITGNIGTAENKATVYAGYSENGTVSGNTVKLTGSADASNVNIVGSNKAFDANANNVLDITGWTAASKTINSVDKINSISFGDVALNSTASYLTINGAINGGSLNGTVITAGNLTGEGDLISGISTKGVNVEALKGEAGKDKVTALSNGVQYAVGGGTEVTVNANSIHVKANAPDTVKAVAGVFYGDDGKPEIGNTNGVLTLNGTVTPVEGVIYAGAYAKTGKASGGTVKLTGNFNGTVYGGYSADGSDTENNTLEIDGSNSVTVNKIKAVDTINITGKVAKNGEKATLNVTEKADFAKASINIAGLDLEGAVKDTTKYNVISNAKVDAAKVTIDGLVKEEKNVVKANIVNKDVSNGLTLTYGGKVVAGSYTDEAGTVATEGGMLKVSDIGALEEGVIYTGAYSSTGAANGTVELAKSFEGTLYGGYQAADKKGSGTLNVRGAGLTVKEIANFDTINFFVPATLAKGETMLKVDSDVNIAGAKVNAGINNKSALDVGDEITLLDAVSLDATGIVAGKVTENDFVDYDMNIEAANNQLKAKITSKGISNENSKSPVETVAGGLVMLNMGADQLAGKGFENAAEAVSLEKATAPNTMTTFASVGGNKVKAKTGSHVDLKGWNFNMGLAKEIDNKSGKLLIAPLAEYGRGSYDSYIDSGVHAEGTSKYWGAGVMARQTNDSGFYYEGSLVGGKSTNDYSTKDIGSGISYDTSAMYLSAHLGAGKIVELGEKDKLNYYGKFFYSRLGSDDVTLSNGAKYSFDASESKRMRLGGRWTRELNAMSKLYAGMAWQYEFDAESRATVNGKTAQAPTMKGHTGILELGWNVKPDNAKFDVDLSFLGYTGKQKGGSLNVNMNWKF